MGIFATVLARVLKGQQNDPRWQQGARSDPQWYPLRAIGVEDAVVDRLKKAVDQDDAHATLNPEDFDRLLATLNLTDVETKQLQAALLAQGVETFLSARMVRFGKTATDAAEIADIVYDALIESFEQEYSKVRGGTLTQAEEHILSLLDECNAMLLALDAAHLRNDPHEIEFWKVISQAALHEVATLSQSLAPSLTPMILKQLSALS